jgi:hypothetical protein
MMIVLFVMQKTSFLQCVMVKDFFVFARFRVVFVSDSGATSTIKIKVGCPKFETTSDVMPIES